jgi:hypothetical protein
MHDTILDLAREAYDLMRPQRDPLMLDAIAVIEQEASQLNVVVSNKPLLVFTHMRPYFKSYMVRLMNLIHNTTFVVYPEPEPEPILNFEVSNFVLQNPILAKQYQHLRPFQIWKVIQILGYTPPEWAWQIKSSKVRNQLFNKASAEVEDVHQRYNFLQSMKGFYV